LQIKKKPAYIKTLSDVDIESDMSNIAQETPKTPTTTQKQLTL
tara:strand:+ start:31404 stop:31532 length:129 start_codon:yes stop_codon:yes gene_type:complete